MENNLNNRTYNRSRLMLTAWGWARKMAKERNDRRFLNTACQFWRVALSFAHENEKARLALVNDYKDTAIETWYGWKLAGYTVSHGEHATAKLDQWTLKQGWWDRTSVAYFTAEQVEKDVAD